MKYIAVGDIHIEAALPYSNGTSRLWREIVNAWDQVLDYADVNKIHKIIVAGDFFNNISVSPVEARAFIYMMGLAKGRGISEIIMVSGNHEVDNDGESFIKTSYDISSDSWPKIILPYDTKLNYMAWLPEEKDHEFFLVDYQHNIDEFRKIIEAAIITGKDRNPKLRTRILVAHQAVKGGKLKSVRSAKGVPQDWFDKNGIIGKNFELCIFGDFHRSQPLPYGKGFYTGSLIMQDFRDEGSTPCFHVVDTETFTSIQVPIDVPNFHTITVTEDKKTGLSYLEYTTKLTKGSYIKIALVGSREFIERIKNTKTIDSLTTKIEKKYSPIKMFVATPQITDRIVTTPTVKKSLSDREIIQKVIEKSETTIPDKLLYSRGNEFITQARRRK